MIEKYTSQQLKAVSVNFFYRQLMPMANMRNWHLDLNRKFYDICFYFEFSPHPWFKALAREITSTDFWHSHDRSHITMKKISPKTMCDIFSLRPMKVQHYHVMPDFQYYSTEYIKLLKCWCADKNAVHGFKVQRDH